MTLCNRHIALKRFLEAIKRLEAEGVQVQKFTIAQAVKHELKYDLNKDELTVIPTKPN